MFLVGSGDGLGAAQFSVAKRETLFDFSDPAAVKVTFSREKGCPSNRSVAPMILSSPSAA